MLNPYEPYDVVTLKLGGNTVLVAESYEIQTSVFTQPSAFALKLGHADAIVDLISKAPPNTPFELAVDGRIQFVGNTDGFTASGGGGGSTLTLRGRDKLAPLHDGYVRSERSFSDITYADLVQAGLDETIKGSYAFSFSNDANRKAVTGAAKKTASASAERLGTTEVFVLTQSAATYGGGNGRIGYTANVGFESIGTSKADGLNKGAGADATQAQEPVAPANSGGQKSIQLKLEQQWYGGVIKPQLDRAGLFLWCAADGSFILSAPNVKQAPTYRFVRRRGQPTRDVTVTGYELKHETTGRHSSYEVHLRRGGGSETRTKGFQIVTDAEMASLGYDRPMCFKDDKCKSIAQAEFLALRRMCEARRHGWGLTYNLSGHSIINHDGDRVSWAIDTIVDLDDEELGIKGLFYVSDVEMSRNPSTGTRIHLMRPSDLVFGELQ